MTNKNTYNLLSQINIPGRLAPIAHRQIAASMRRTAPRHHRRAGRQSGTFRSQLWASVELTVALHYVYDTPYDRIVWDVGHQAYGHKILTGRREAFLHQPETARACVLSPHQPKANTTRSPADMRPIPSPPLLGMAVAAAETGRKRPHM